jgi:hypothetical protein
MFGFAMSDLARFSVERQGRVSAAAHQRVQADVGPPAEIVVLLRQHRAAGTALLASKAVEQDVAPALPNGVVYGSTT